MEAKNNSNRELQLQTDLCCTKVRRRPTRSVIVIGAGMAGLAAARALYDASIQVVVLESRNRIGGRVCTDYTLGFPVDLGASWLHGVDTENPLAQVIGKLGLPLYRTSGDNSVLYDHDLESYALFDTDGKQVSHDLVAKVGEIFKMALQETEKIREEYEDDMSVHQAFSIAFARRSDLRVTNVVRHHAGVKVTMEDGTVLAADAAIIAAPLGVLKAGIIKFEPRLPKWKEAAISELGVGIENKIVLHFDQVFWPNVEFLGVVAESSGGCSYFLNLHKATGHRVLVYMPAGKLAEHIAKMSDEEAANFAFSQLKTIIPDANSPVQFLVSHWGTDINSLGSYSFDKVGNPHDLYEKLRTPVDNLFFAGEATSMRYPGSVHGAYSTGLSAAEDCRMRVLERYGEIDVLQEDDSDEETSIPILISRL
ncbi:hypothetical protein V2J09_016844 [Rumex salicifolius]